MEDIRKNLLIDIVIALILAAIVLFFIRPTVVKQTSMQDTLQPNDYLIMYKRAYVNKTPQRGDIVISSRASQPRAARENSSSRELSDCRATLLRLRTISFISTAKSMRRTTCVTGLPPAI